ncbi:MAG: hydrogenase formation protein HypD [Lachnospiraceae bacterium]|nr:hydrogenase formation protein HypD [Lachnospiraceae bacterium]
MAHGKERPIRLMEICGTHTHAIARAGIKQLLPEDVRLLSGPGCPVCVTPPEAIDALVSLSRLPDVTVCTYGDMLRVPGTSPDISLLKEKGHGSRVEMVFSPMDALEMAKADPSREVVFAGVGFETTAPGTLAAVRAAKEQNVPNFSVFLLLRRIEPAVRALLADPESKIDGFLCPGHVAVILGEEGFRFLPEEYRLPAVISGFEPADIWLSVKELIRQVREKDPQLVNTYTRTVSREGNRLALQLMEEMTESCAALWRGLGTIENSAFALKADYKSFDAAEKFDIRLPDKSAPTACRCGDVICGKIEPAGCPFFGKVCTPEAPLGPCMVSSEGSCAAAYTYRNW